MKLSNNILALLACSIILIAGNEQLLAQDFNENNYTHYTKEQGLSNNNITGILQDSTGYIWLATGSGLNRFGGSNFLQFHSTDDSLSLPAESLRGLLWIDKKRLASYGDGLHIVDTRTGENKNLFVPYSNKQYQYKFNLVMAVRTNPAGEIFLLTRAGLYHFDKNYKLIFRFDFYAKEEIAKTSFTWGRDLMWLNDNELIALSTEGIYHYRIDTRQFKKMDAGDCPMLDEFLNYPKIDYQFFQIKPGVFFIMNLNNDSIIYLNIPTKKRTVAMLPFHPAKEEIAYRSQLSAISDSVFYLTGHVSGFYKLRLYPESGKTIFYPEKYFPFYYCRQLFIDKDRNLWIATNRGAFRQDNRKTAMQQAPIPAILQAAYPNLVIDDIYAVGDQLYVATSGHGGILMFNKNTLQFIRQISFKQFYRDPDNIFSIVEANDKSLFVGSNGPLFKLNPQTNRVTEVALQKADRENSWIASLTKDRKGNVWMASGNIYKYDASTNTISIITEFGDPIDKIDWPRMIKEDAAGNIWIGGHGLLRYNTTSKTYDRLVDSFPYIKIPNRQVNMFIADKKNNLWINTANNGLVCYDIEKKTFRHFTRDDGLPDNNIASMIEIHDKLWIATYSGIACMDLNNLKIKSFGKEDGFPDQPIVSGANFYYDSAKNKLFLGVSNVILKFDPEALLRESQPPHLFIENLVTSDQHKILFPGKNVTSSWRNNGITVTIGSIDYLTSNGQRFAYRLEKDNSYRWQQLGTQNTFSISNLSPGSHRVQVKLLSINNRWPEQVSEFNVIITPPFWKQTWFIIASGIFIALCIYQFFRWRTGNIRKKEQAKTHFQQLKAEEYKNQYELEQISNYFSSSMAGKKNIDDVLWDVTKNLIGKMNYEDCIIYMWNNDKTKMIQKAAHGPKGNSKYMDIQAFDVEPGQGVVGYVIQTKEPLLVADTRLDSRYRVDDMNRLCELCVPIIHDNELIGIIDSEHPTANYFQERDIKILTTIAMLVGNRLKQIESDQMLERKEKEITLINLQLAEAQLSALQAQMNPHFIFNSLNSIKGMILDNEQQKASRYLSKFATMIRITLNQSREVFTTLYENIEHLESYLMMEKLRFDDSFTFDFIVDDNIDVEETLIPTLMLQPLAENAIWHGLMHQQGEKKLSINFYNLGGMICCNIEDNGIGIKQSEVLKQLNNPHHHSVGLSNLKNRIKILNEKYDAGCTFEINDLKDFDKSKTGTRAVLCFNIINKPLS